jgi:hypothetical protein
MKDLLKEAIADAKAVRETALANAKIALEEAFTPRLQSMLSAKLSEEEDMEMDIEEEEDMEVAVEEPVAPEVEVEEPVAEGDYAEDEMSEEGDYAEDEMSEEGDYAEDEMSEEDDLELEAILRELDDEEVSAEPDMGVSEEEELDMTENEDEVEMTEEDDADVSLEEVIKALREEEGEEEKVEETEEAEVEADLEEAYKVIRFLKSKINEVNLLNAKLLFSNKLFRNYPLSESQKMKVIENFDRAKSLREVKLVFGTLAESFTVNKTRRKIVKESYASKATRSTAPKKILSEGNALAARWKKLANLK